MRVGITHENDLRHVQMRSVIKIVKHPVFSSKYHDIALIKLDKDLNFDVNTRPACLHTEKTINVDKALATGWGKIEQHGETSDNLLKVTLERFSVQECNNVFRRDISKVGSTIGQGILDDYMICYGSRTDRKDTCQVCKQ